VTFGWQGETTRLVPLDRGRHLVNAITWLNDPEVTRWTETGDLPITRLAEEEYFRKAEEGQDTAVAFAVETLDGDHVGFSGLQRIDHRPGTAYSGSLIGRRDLWGRGLGTDAARVRSQFAFDVLNLRLVLSEVMADNTASLVMLGRAGYDEMGRIPGRYWKRGAFRDQVILGLRRERWERR